MNAQMELLPLTHEPFPPYPRKDMASEKVYAEAWRRQMAGATDDGIEWDMFTGIVTNLGEPTQRDANVAASLICWLGTNCGRAFLFGALERSIRRSEQDRQLAWQFQWTLENRRLTHANRGLRLLESIVNGEVSARDLEVADCVALWLGSDSGQAFIIDCERQVHPITSSSYLHLVERLEKAEAVLNWAAKGAAA